MTWLTTSRWRRVNLNDNPKAGESSPLSASPQNLPRSPLSSVHTSQGLNRSFPGVVSWNIRSGPSSLAITVTGAPKGASL
jgi:hypothetical protein